MLTRNMAEGPPGQPATHTYSRYFDWTIGCLRQVVYDIDHDDDALLETFTDDEYEDEFDERGLVDQADMMHWWRRHGRLEHEHGEEGRGRWSRASPP